MPAAAAAGLPPLRYLNWFVMTLFFSFFSLFTANDRARAKQESRFTAVHSCILHYIFFFLTEHPRRAGKQSKRKRGRKKKKKKKKELLHHKLYLCIPALSFSGGGKA